MEAANAVKEIAGRAGKVHQAIFFLQDGREAGLRVVLWARLNAAGLELSQSLDDEFGANDGQAWSQGFGGIIGRDGEFLLKQDVAGVEAGVDTHGGDPGDGFAVGDGPLDGRGTPIFREQRGVQIDVAEGRKLEHPLGNDAAVADDDDGVGLERAQLSAEFVIASNSVRLGDRKVQTQSGFFHRRRDQFEAASFWTIRLGNHEMQA